MEKEYIDPNIVCPPSDVFFYRDKEGQWRGPFGEDRMLAWYRGGFFTSDLEIMRNKFNTVHKLGLCQEQQDINRIPDQIVRTRESIPAVASSQ